MKILEDDVPEADTIKERKFNPIKDYTTPSSKSSLKKERKANKNRGHSYIPLTPRSKYSKITRDGGRNSCRSIDARDLSKRQANSTFELRFSKE